MSRVVIDWFCGRRRVECTLHVSCWMPERDQATMRELMAATTYVWSEILDIREREDGQA